jgi:hypothetical protein
LARSPLGLYAVNTVDGSFIELPKWLARDRSLIEEDLRRFAPDISLSQESGASADSLNSAACRTEFAPSSSGSSSSSSSSSSSASSLPSDHLDDVPIVGLSARPQPTTAAPPPRAPAHRTPAPGQRTPAPRRARTCKPRTPSRCPQPEDRLAGQRLISDWQNQSPPPRQLAAAADPTRASSSPPGRSPFHPFEVD